MRVVRYIHLGQIDVDFKYPLCKQTFDMAKFLENGGEFPPIHLGTISNGRFLIRNGRHRFTAHKLVGLSYIKAKFSTTIMKGY